jgi:diguanylate cyclase (GGDEF)-like protein
VSFRNRLGLFFVLIVIVPMMAVAVLLFGQLSQSERDIGSANIRARQQAAQRLFGVQQRAAGDRIRSIGKDHVLGQSLRADDIPRARKRAAQLIRSQRLARIVYVENGRTLFAVGRKTAVAPAQLPLETPRHKPIGTLEVSLIDAPDFAEQVRRVSGLEIVVRNGSRILTGTLDEAADIKPASSGDTVQLGGRSYRVDAFAPAGFNGQRIRMFTLGVPITSHGAVRDGRLVIGAILLGFLVIALACAVLVQRSLQQQLARFLEAARRLAGGDFSAKVTTVGRDEFADLGEEFNKMSGELERRLVELGQERERVQGSMRRLGDAVASKLDRDALLEIVVRTAVDGVAADAGRAYVRGADRVTLQERARAGNMNGLDGVVGSVEADALSSGSPREASHGEASAMAHPLRAANGGGEAVGVVSVGRSGRAFTQSERELFHYLAGQAGRSMESVDRHETVTRESITDDLTGLSNRRGFDDALAGEIERAKRFGGTLGLVLIDLDDFKAVNDTYGHPQGDVVLREVARVLRESSREIDHPARYGGEELALVLPGTDLEGAYNLAERVRERIAALYVPRLDHAGALHVTASCGVAAVPQTAADRSALVAAADQALYEAKRGGKNKSVRAR